jgi:hypothetical protein
MFKQNLASILATSAMAMRLPSLGQHDKVDRSVLGDSVHDYLHPKKPNLKVCSNHKKKSKSPCYERGTFLPVNQTVRFSKSKKKKMKAAARKLQNVLAARTPKFQAERKHSRRNPFFTGIKGVRLGRPVYGLN